VIWVLHHPRRPALASFSSYRAVSPDPTCARCIRYSVVGAEIRHMVHARLLRPADRANLTTAERSEQQKGAMLVPA